MQDVWLFESANAAGAVVTRMQPFFLAGPIRPYPDGARFFRGGVRILGDTKASNVEW